MRTGPSSVRACCDLHNEHCEPQTELCCEGCTEIHHGTHRGCNGWGYSGSHHDGSRCVLEPSPLPNAKAAK